MEWLLFVVCLIAAVTDLLWRRIPNIWLGSWFLTGLLLTGVGVFPLTGSTAGSELLLSLEHPGGAEAIIYLGRAAAVILIFYPAWKFRMIGAGDIKLCGVMSAFMGLLDFGYCFLYSLFLGGVLSFLYMVVTRSLWRRLTCFLAWFGQCISSSRWVPYRSKQNMEGTISFAPVILAGYLVWWLL